MRKTQQRRFRRKVRALAAQKRRLVGELRAARSQCHRLLHVFIHPKPTRKEAGESDC